MIPRGMRTAVGRLDRPCRQRRPFPLATIGMNMNEIELLRLQDEALYFTFVIILQRMRRIMSLTDEDMIEILIADKKDEKQTYQDS